MEGLLKKKNVTVKVKGIGRQGKKTIKKHIKIFILFFEILVIYSYTYLIQISLLKFRDNK